MQPVIQAPVSGQRGFTLLEAMVVVAVIGILLAIGLPNMQGWLSANAATGAAQFYAEGVKLARGQALANNGRSRLVFSANEQTGQLDWEVDVCFPSVDDLCAPTSTRWSSVDEPAAGPEGGAIETVSVVRSSAALPGPGVVRITPDSDARAIYFTELGWVDGGQEALLRLDFVPAKADAADAFPPSALVVTLAGAAVVCRPNVDPGDSRRCP